MPEREVKVKPLGAAGPSCGTRSPRGADLAGGKNTASAATLERTSYKRQAREICHTASAGTVSSALKAAERSYVEEDARRRRSLFIRRQSEYVGGPSPSRFPGMGPRRSCFALGPTGMGGSENARKPPAATSRWNAEVASPTPRCTALQERARSMPGVSKGSRTWASP